MIEGGAKTKKLRLHLQAVIFIKRMKVFGRFGRF